MGESKGQTARTIALFFLQPATPAQVREMAGAAREALGDRPVLVLVEPSRDSADESWGEVSAEVAAPLVVLRDSAPLGYGARYKAAIALSLRHGASLLMTLHPQGLFDVGSAKNLIRAVEEGADVAIGTRFEGMGRAITSMHPLSLLGNLALSHLATKATGLELQDWHCGQRCYHLPVLARLPYMLNSDDFQFDVEVLLQLLELKARIVSVPVKPYSAPELTGAAGAKYFIKSLYAVGRYRAHKMGFGTGSTAFNSLEYELKNEDLTSHSLIAKVFEGRPPMNVLDVGCSSGRLAARIRSMGHRVAGIDVVRHDGVEENTDAFLILDPQQASPSGLGEPFDAIILADVLEHMSDPLGALRRLKSVLKSEGFMVISVPNFSHWYARLKVGLGLFDYDRRGIFDEGHLRFFTRRSLRRLLARAALEIADIAYAPIPLEVVSRGRKPATGDPGNTKTGGRLRGLLKAVSLAQRLALKVSPNLFAYQLVCVVRPKRLPSPVVGTLEVVIHGAPGADPEAASARTPVASLGNGALRR
jgi:SAM-dependent methyltransferase